jgi:hypothetical protein
MGFTSPVERANPNRLADERDALTQQLDFHRATLLRKLEGLDEEPLRRPMRQLMPWSDSTYEPASEPGRSSPPAGSTTW